VTESAEVLARRFAARAVAAERFGPSRFAGALRARDAAEARGHLASGRVELNRDARPIAALYSLVLWDMRAAGGGRPSPLWSLRSISWWWPAGALLVVAAARAGLRRARRRDAPDGLWSAFVAGLWGLGLEVVLLLVVQNAAGSIYWLLGLLVALFMVGLAAGTAAASRRVVAGVDAARRLALRVDVAAIALTLATPVLPALGPAAAWAAGAWLLAAGAITGAAFPPAVADLRRWREEASPGRAAGLADAADHFGACVGALTVGLLAVPLLGLWPTCLALAVARGVSLVGWAGPTATASPATSR
jgi:spermidine synthase